MWSATQIAATALRERPVFILDGNVFQGTKTPFQEKVIHAQFRAAPLVQ